MREARAWEDWKSRPQKGSGYWLVQERRGGSKPRPPQHSEGQVGARRVGTGQVGAGHALVVNDDPEVRRALARCLGPELVLHIAASVRQARAVVAGLQRVDLAFVDLHLPDGSGEEVLELLRKWPDAIAVLIAGAVAGPAAATGPAPGAASVGENLLKNRALANLVLARPIAPRVVEALKQAALASSK